MKTTIMQIILLIIDFICLIINSICLGINLSTITQIKRIKEDMK